MAKQDPLEAIQEYRRNIEGPRPAAAVEDIHGLNEAVDQGEVLVVVKPAKLNGKLYKQGDELAPDVYNRLRTFRKLMDHGFFSPKPQWDAGRQFYAAKKFQDNVLQPLEASYQKAERKLADATRDLAAARFVVESADERLEIAKEQVEAKGEAILAALGEVELEA